MVSKTRFSKKDIDKIKELSTTGVTRTQIAEKMGFKPLTFYKLIDETKELKDWFDELSGIEQQIILDKAMEGLLSKLTDTTVEEETIRNGRVVEQRRKVIPASYQAIIHVMKNVKPDTWDKLAKIKIDADITKDESLEEQVTNLLQTYTTGNTKGDK